MTSTIENINLNGTNFENIKLPENYNMKQYAGITLNFIVENNLYANILTHESEEFSEVTGININIRAVDFDTLIQKRKFRFYYPGGQISISLCRSLSDFKSVL